MENLLMFTIQILCRVTIRESYWTWQCCWETWTKREKILLLVVVILTIILSAVLGVLGLVLDSNRNCLDSLRNETLKVVDKSTYLKLY